MAEGRVIIVNTVFGTGSVGRIVQGIYNALEEHGYECMVAYGRGEAPVGYNSYKIAPAADMYFHGILSRITDRHSFFSTKVTKDFIKVIEEYNPDIIHLHNVHGYYLNIKLLFEYLKRKDIRIIWTLHDCWTFTGHCAHFDYVGCDKWKEGCNNCEQLKEYPKSIFVDNSKRNYYDKSRLFTGFERMELITPSKWLESKVKASYMKGYETHVIPTGIDLHTFKPIAEIDDYRKKYNLLDKRILLGVANPWRERKGLYEFVKLSEKLTDDYKIVLVGLNDEQIKKLPKDIVGIKRTDSAVELAALYSLSDIYINLTLEDTFPTTNIEAIACGTPVITYDVGGSKESLNESCGIIVEKNNIDKVIEAIDCIVNNPQSYSLNNCVNRSKMFSNTLRYEQYVEEIYEK